MYHAIFLLTTKLVATGSVPNPIHHSNLLGRAPPGNNPLQLYISPDGVDSSTCGLSQGSPCSSLQSALHTAQASSYNEYIVSASGDFITILSPFSLSSTSLSINGIQTDGCIFQIGYVANAEDVINLYYCTFLACYLTFVLNSNSTQLPHVVTVYGNSFTLHDVTFRPSDVASNIVLSGELIKSKYAAVSITNTSFSHIQTGSSGFALISSYQGSSFDLDDTNFTECSPLAPIAPGSGEIPIADWGCGVVCVSAIGSETIRIGETGTVIFRDISPIRQDTLLIYLSNESRRVTLLLNNIQFITEHMQSTVSAVNLFICTAYPAEHITSSTCPVLKDSNGLFPTIDCTATGSIYILNSTETNPCTYITDVINTSYIDPTAPPHAFCGRQDRPCSHMSLLFCSPCKPQSYDAHNTILLIPTHTHTPEYMSLTSIYTVLIVKPSEDDAIVQKQLAHIDNSFSLFEFTYGANASFERISFLFLGENQHFNVTVFRCLTGASLSLTNVSFSPDPNDVNIPSDHLLTIASSIFLADSGLPKKLSIIDGVWSNISSTSALIRLFSFNDTFELDGIEFNSVASQNGSIISASFARNAVVHIGETSGLSLTGATTTKMYPFAFSFEGSPKASSFIHSITVHTPFDPHIHPPTVLLAYDETTWITSHLDLFTILPSPLTDEMLSASTPLTVQASYAGAPTVLCYKTSTDTRIVAPWAIDVSNCGTITLPCHSFSKAYTSNLNEQTVFMFPGDYGLHSQSVTIRKIFTLHPVDDAHPITQLAGRVNYQQQLSVTINGSTAVATFQSLTFIVTEDNKEYTLFTLPNGTLILNDVNFTSSTSPVTAKCVIDTYSSDKSHTLILNGGTWEGVSAYKSSHALIEERLYGVFTVDNVTFKNCRNSEGGTMMRVYYREDHEQDSEFKLGTASPVHIEGNSGPQTLGITIYTAAVPKALLISELTFTQPSSGGPYTDIWVVSPCLDSLFDAAHFPFYSATQSDFPTLPTAESFWPPTRLQAHNADIELSYVYFTRHYFAPYGDDSYHQCGSQGRPCRTVNGNSGYAVIEEFPMISTSSAPIEVILLPGVHEAENDRLQISLSYLRGYSTESSVKKVKSTSSSLIYIYQDNFVSHISSLTFALESTSLLSRTLIHIHWGSLELTHVAFRPSDPPVPPDTLPPLLTLSDSIIQADYWGGHNTIYGCTFTRLSSSSPIINMLTTPELRMDACNFTDCSRGSSNALSMKLSDEHAFYIGEKEEVRFTETASPTANSVFINFTTQPIISRLDKVVFSNDRTTDSLTADIIIVKPESARYSSLFTAANFPLFCESNGQLPTFSDSEETYDLTPAYPTSPPSHLLLALGAIRPKVLYMAPRTDRPCTGYTEAPCERFARLVTTVAYQEAAFKRTIKMAEGEYPPQTSPVTFEHSEITITPLNAGIVIINITTLLDDSFFTVPSSASASIISLIFEYNSPTDVYTYPLFDISSPSFSLTNVTIRPHSPSPAVPPATTEVACAHLSASLIVAHSATVTISGCVVQNLISTQNEANEELPLLDIQDGSHFTIDNTSFTNCTAGIAPVISIVCSSSESLVRIGQTIPVSITSLYQPACHGVTMDLGDQVRDVIVSGLSFAPTRTADSPSADLFLKGSHLSSLVTEDTFPLFISSTAEFPDIPDDLASTLLTDPAPMLVWFGDFSQTLCYVSSSSDANEPCTSSLPCKRLNDALNSERFVSSASLPRTVFFTDEYQSAETDPISLPAGKLTLTTSSHPQDTLYSITQPTNQFSTSHIIALFTLECTCSLTVSHIHFCLDWNAQRSLELCLFTLSADASLTLSNIRIQASLDDPLTGSRGVVKLPCPLIYSTSQSSLSILGCLFENIQVCSYLDCLIKIDIKSFQLDGTTFKNCTPASDDDMRYVANRCSIREPAAGVLCIHASSATSIHIGEIDTVTFEEDHSLRTDLVTLYVGDSTADVVIDKLTFTHPRTDHDASYVDFALYSTEPLRITDTAYPLLKLSEDPPITIVDTPIIHERSPSTLRPYSYMLYVLSDTLYDPMILHSPSGVRSLLCGASTRPCQNIANTFVSLVGNHLTQRRMEIQEGTYPPDTFCVSSSLSISNDWQIVGGGMTYEDTVKVIGKKANIDFSPFYGPYPSSSGILAARVSVSNITLALLGGSEAVDTPLFSITTSLSLEDILIRPATTMEGGTEEDTLIMESPTFPIRLLEGCTLSVIRVQWKGLSCSPVQILPNDPLKPGALLFFTPLSGNLSLSELVFTDCPTTNSSLLNIASTESAGISLGSPYDPSLPSDDTPWAVISGGVYPSSYPRIILNFASGWRGLSVNSINISRLPDHDEEASSSTFHFDLALTLDHFTDADWTPFKFLSSTPVDLSLFTDDTPAALMNITTTTSDYPISLLLLHNHFTGTLIAPWGEDSDSCGTPSSPCLSLTSSLELTSPVELYFTEHPPPDRTVTISTMIGIVDNTQDPPQRAVQQIASLPAGMEESAIFTGTNIKITDIDFVILSAQPPSHNYLFDLSSDNKLELTAVTLKPDNTELYLLPHSLVRARDHANITITNFSLSYISSTDYSGLFSFGKGISLDLSDCLFYRCFEDVGPLFFFNISRSETYSITMDQSFRINSFCPQAPAIEIRYDETDGDSGTLSLNPNIYTDCSDQPHLYIISRSLSTDVTAERYPILAGIDFADFTEGFYTHPTSNVKAFLWHTDPLHLSADDPTPSSSSCGSRKNPCSSLSAVISSAASTTSGEDVPLIIIQRGEHSSETSEITLDRSYIFRGQSSARDVTKNVVDLETESQSPTLFTIGGASNLVNVSFTDISFNLQATSPIFPSEMHTRLFSVEEGALTLTSVSINSRLSSSPGPSDTGTIPTAAKLTSPLITSSPEGTLILTNATVMNVAAASPADGLIVCMRGHAIMDGSEFHNTTGFDRPTITAHTLPTTAHTLTGQQARSNAEGECTLLLGAQSAIKFSGVTTYTAPHILVHEGSQGYSQIALSATFSPDDHTDPLPTHIVLISPSLSHFASLQCLSSPLANGSSFPSPPVAGRYEFGGQYLSSYAVSLYDSRDTFYVGGQTLSAADRLYCGSRFNPCVTLDELAESPVLKTATIYTVKLLGDTTETGIDHYVTFDGTYFSLSPLEGSAKIVYQRNWPSLTLCTGTQSEDTEATLRNITFVLPSFNEAGEAESHPLLYVGCTHFSIGNVSIVSSSSSASDLTYIKGTLLIIFTTVIDINLFSIGPFQPEQETTIVGLSAETISIENSTFDRCIPQNGRCLDLSLYYTHPTLTVGKRSTVKFIHPADSNNCGTALYLLVCPYSSNPPNLLLNHIFFDIPHSSSSSPPSTEWHYPADLFVELTGILLSDVVTADAFPVLLAHNGTGMFRDAARGMDSENEPEVSLLQFVLHEEIPSESQSTEHVEESSEGTPQESGQASSEGSQQDASHEESTQQISSEESHQDTSEENSEQISSEGNHHEEEQNSHSHSEQSEETHGSSSESEQETTHPDGKGSKESEQSQASSEGESEASSEKNEGEEGPVTPTDGEKDPKENPPRYTTSYILLACLFGGSLIGIIVIVVILFCIYFRCIHAQHGTFEANTKDVPMTATAVSAPDTQANTNSSTASATNAALDDDNTPVELYPQPTTSAHPPHTTAPPFMHQESQPSPVLPLPRLKQKTKRKIIPIQTSSQRLRHMYQQTPQSTAHVNPRPDYMDYPYYDDYL